jgi:ribosomal-protein-alanine N-acetyltransferase
MTKPNVVSPAILIRPLTINDVEAVAQLEQLVPVGQTSAPLPQQEYVNALQNPTSSLIVAQMTDKIVGYAWLQMFYDEAHVMNIIAHPHRLRMGIGTALFEHLLAEAHRQSAAIITLEVRRSNIAAQHLYKNFGLIEVGVRKRYYRDNQEDAIIMTRLLA